MRGNKEFFKIIIVFNINRQVNRYNKHFFFFCQTIKQIQPDLKIKDLNNLFIYVRNIFYFILSPPATAPTILWMRGKCRGWTCVFRYQV